MDKIEFVNWQFGFCQLTKLGGIYWHVCLWFRVFAWDSTSSFGWGGPGYPGTPVHEWRSWAPATVQTLSLDQTGLSIDKPRLSTGKSHVLSIGKARIVNCCHLMGPCSANSWTQVRRLRCPGPGVCLVSIIWESSQLAPYILHRSCIYFAGVLFVVFFAAVLHCCLCRAIEG